MEGENLQGWIVPLSKTDEFEKVWKAHEEDDEFVEFFGWAEWFKNGEEIDVKFVKN